MTPGLGRLGKVLGAVKLVAPICDWISKTIRSGVVAPRPDDTEPMPLTHRAAERQAEFARRAGHESEGMPKPPR